MEENEKLEYQIKLSDKAVLKGTLEYIKDSNHTFGPMEVEITIKDDTSVKVSPLDSNEFGTGEHLEGALDDLFEGMVFLKEDGENDCGNAGRVESKTELVLA